MALDFTTVSLEDEKQWTDAFKIVRENDLQHRIIQSAKLTNTMVRKEQS